jgi:hypothetical protein
LFRDGLVFVFGCKFTLFLDELGVGNARMTRVVDQGGQDTAKLGQGITRYTVRMIMERRHSASFILKVHIGRGHNARKQFNDGKRHVTVKPQNENLFLDS